MQRFAQRLSRESQTRHINQYIANVKKRWEPDVIGQIHAGCIITGAAYGVMSDSPTYSRRMLNAFECACIGSVMTAMTVTAPIAGPLIIGSVAWLNSESTKAAYTAKLNMYEREITGHRLAAQTSCTD
jgi:hypothetical protein